MAVKYGYPNCPVFRQVTLVMIGVTDVATGFAVSASTFQEFSVEAFGTYLAGRCLNMIDFSKMTEYKIQFYQPDHQYLSAN